MKLLKLLYIYNKMQLSKTFIARNKISQHNIHFLESVRRSFASASNEFDLAVIGGGPGGIYQTLSISLFP